MPTLEHTALIVVSFGSATLVEENVAGLAAERPELDVVIVDCFSTEDERQAVRAMCARRAWHPVLLDTNAGFGGGVNRGANEAITRGADVLLVLNPDAVLPAASADALAAAVRAEPLLLAAPVIRRSDGGLWTQGTDLYLDDGTMAGVARREQRGERERTMWVSGASFAVTAELWRRLGGFEDAYFLYWEDVDLSVRTREVGGDVRVLSEVGAVHDEGGTHEDQTRGRAKSETYYYYNVRNRLLFARLRLDRPHQRAWRRSMLRVSWGIILQGGRRQLLEGVAPWRALLRGMRDGLRGVTGPRG